MLRARAAVGGFGALLKGNLSRGIEVERECCTFTPPTDNPCRDSTQQPFVYESSLSTIGHKIVWTVSRQYTKIVFLK